VGGVGGVLAAYALDVPCGPAIVLCAIVLFAGSLPIGRFRNR
jgi:ABC-type Mn2+/Zn2+ transport system permease subunit